MALIPVLTPVIPAGRPDHRYGSLATSNSTNPLIRIARDDAKRWALAFKDLARTSFDTTTKDYVTRSRATGKSNCEIRRNLKRYVCRYTFRQLQTIMAGHPL